MTGVQTCALPISVLEGLEKAGRLPPSEKKWIGIVQQAIPQCRHAAIALGDWKTLLDQPADVLPELLELRGTQSVQAGRVADAVQAVAKLRELGTATAGQLYNAARVYSLCAAAIKPDPDPSPPSSPPRVSSTSPSP